jgi:hypothetical protein
MKTVGTILIGTAMAVLCISLTASAATLYVSAYGAGEYGTPSAAYAAAVNGDTILIGPGVYTVYQIQSFKRLTWLGAGWDQSKLILTNQVVLNSSASGSVLEGLRIEGTMCTLDLYGGVDSVTVRRCLLTSSYYPIIYALDCGRLYVEDCVFVQQPGTNVMDTPNAEVMFRGCIFALIGENPAYCFVNAAQTEGSFEIYNCVFLNQRAIYAVTGAQSVVAINNIFYDWGPSATFGTYPWVSTFDYNASQTISAPGTNTINLTTNPFLNYSVSTNYQEGITDLHLTQGSGLINTGHPDILDLDQSRSDFGIYGGPRPMVDYGVPPYPWTLNITITPFLVGQGTQVNASALGRIGPQY